METLIARIEHPHDGIGMFRTAFRPIWGDKEYYLYDRVLNRHSDLPVPHYDSIVGDPDETPLDCLKDGLEWFCGYKSVDELKKWVETEELTHLITKYGLKVYAIKATQVQVGLFQSLFTKESITSKEDITQLFIN